MALDPKKPRTMQVRPNPKHARDHYGEPCAAVPREGDITSWVGARVDYKRSREEGRICFLFDALSDPPVVVPVTAYYARKIEEGELLPACDVSQSFATTDAAKRAAKNAA